jgi:hypothetical protein
VRYAKNGRELVTRILQRIADDNAPAEPPPTTKSAHELSATQVRLSAQKRASLPDIFEQLTELVAS